MASSASSVLPRIATATRNTLRSFTSASNARPVSAEDAIHGLQIVFLPHRLFWRLCAHDIRQDYRSNGFNETGHHEGHAPRGVPFAARPVLRDNVTDSGSTPERNEGIPRVLWPTGGEAGCGFRSSAFKNSSTRST